MVKIFVGNLPDNVSPDAIRERFESIGKVLECDILGSYGFVHMEKEDEADEAIRSAQFLFCVLKVLLFYY